MSAKILCVTLLGVFGLPLLHGQADTARIVGTITDPTGAVIPGASITVKNERTSLTRKTIANERGQYLVSQLAPSQYGITAEAKGMASAEFSGVTLQVGQERTLDMKMQAA